ncbi:hypothetical protein SISNIDRAFT_450262 [Sistotremastrum niveocremeum HHB9708]|uniref:Uncharacterized protein n=1 Tax=Sistotremastrum niveocremeum HHB9708 TaxID=1314777 RepID=A0A164Z1Q9_9AGAM|nr:hypothetical protein SISNIDRAFT_450262 [Sistotremastrum niveocremeum HHB9708]
MSCSSIEAARRSLSSNSQREAEESREEFIYQATRDMHFAFHKLFTGYDEVVQASPPQYVFISSPGDLEDNMHLWSSKSGLLVDETDVSRRYSRALPHLERLISLIFEELEADDASEKLYPSLSSRDIIFPEYEDGIIRTTYFRQGDQVNEYICLPRSSDVLLGEKHWSWWNYMFRRQPLIFERCHAPGPVQDLLFCLMLCAPGWLEIRYTPPYPSKRYGIICEGMPPRAWLKERRSSILEFLTKQEYKLLLRNVTSEERVEYLVVNSKSRVAVRC